MAIDRTVRRMAVGVRDREYAARHGQLQSPVSFMHIAVVVCAQWHEVAHVGTTVIAPVRNMVRLALRNWHFAVGYSAVRIHGFNGLALIARRQP